MAQLFLWLVFSFVFFKNLICCLLLLQVHFWHILLPLISCPGIVKQWQSVLSADSVEFTTAAIKPD